jgi:hypothetical protein
MEPRKSYHPRQKSRAWTMQGTPLHTRPPRFGPVTGGQPNFKRRKRREDKYWLCIGPARMTRSLALLHTLHTLPQCYACGSERGGVGREGSEKHTGSPFQPTLGRMATAVFGAIRSGKDDGRGTGPTRQKWMSGSFGRRRRRGRDAEDKLLSLFSFCSQVRCLPVRGTHTPRFAHSDAGGMFQGRQPVSFAVLLSAYHFGVRDYKREENKQKLGIRPGNFFGSWLGRPASKRDY